MKIYRQRSKWTLSEQWVQRIGRARKSERVWKACKRRELSKLSMACGASMLDKRAVKVVCTRTCVWISGFCLQILHRNNTQLSAELPQNALQIDGVHGSCGAAQGGGESAQALLIADCCDRVVDRKGAQDARSCKLTLKVALTCGYEVQAKEKLCDCRLALPNTHNTQANTNIQRLTCCVMLCCFNYSS